MRGGEKRHANALADQILEIGDVAAIARHQRFGIRNVRRDPEQLDVLPLRGRSGERARPHLTQLHLARTHRTDHVGPARIHAPVDLVARGLLHLAGLHHQPQWHRHVLIRKPHRLLAAERLTCHGQNRRRCRSLQQTPLSHTPCLLTL